MTARGGSRWTPEQIERGAAAMQDAYLATIDRFDAMNEFRVSVVAALDAVFPVGEPDDERRWKLKRAFGLRGITVGTEVMGPMLEPGESVEVAAVRAAEEENPE